MSRTKLDQAIYYIGDDSEFGTAGKLRENVAERRGVRPEQIPLVTFGTKDQDVPRELILLAHSDDTRTTIGGITPKQLAEDIAEQFKGKENQLESIKLVSCEGGYGDNSLAKQLVVELGRLGFNNVVVKAATHPKESKIGGVVSVTTQAGISRLTGNEDGKVTAVMYGNQKTAYYIRWKELDRMRGRGKKAREGWTEELDQEMQSLAKKHNNFAGFDERHPDYCVIKLVGDINDLDAPHNCYSNGKVTPLSLDAAIALETLREKRFASSRYIQGKKDRETVVGYLDNVIAKINENPAMDKDQILQIISDNELSEKAKRVIDISAIQGEVSETITRKTMAMDPSKRPSKAETIASELEKNKDYYDRLLAKDGIFDKMWRSIYGAGEFTQGLRKLLIQVSNDTLLAKATREDIIGRIESQKEKDAEKLVDISTTFSLGNFLGKKKVIGEERRDTPLNNLYNALETYCAKPNPEPEDWSLVVDAYKNYDQNSPKGKISKVLEDLVRELGENNKQFANIGKGLDEVKSQVKNAIDTYIAKYDKGDETDNTHIPKVAVMKAIKDYVDSPSEENWKKVEQSTIDNPGWDKGMFSKVRFMMSEARKVHEEQEQMESEISSSMNKGMK